MNPITTSTLAIGLGLVYALIHLYGVLNPRNFAALARKFPRNTNLGYPLILIATAGFIYYVAQEPIADFKPMKPYLCVFFALVAIGTCIYVRDFLPVRGLAVVWLVLAKLMVDTARWADSDWRLVIIVWAYLYVLGGMWFTISPWRFRDLLEWATATEGRTRLWTGCRVAFGLLVMILGFTVFR